MKRRTVASAPRCASHSCSIRVTLSRISSLRCIVAHCDDFLRSAGLVKPDPRVGLGTLIRTKQPFQTEDVTALPTHGDKQRQALIDLTGARTLIGVPMLKANEVIGASPMRKCLRVGESRRLAILLSWQKKMARNGSRRTGPSLNQIGGTYLLLVFNPPADIPPVGPWANEPNTGLAASEHQHEK